MVASTRTPRPYLALVTITLALIVLLGAVGTLAYLAGLGGYAPLTFAYVPLTVVIAILLTARGDWRSVGFRRVRLGRPRAITSMVLAALLPIAVVACSSGLAMSGVSTFGLLGLALLVAFVEETLFRGILLRLFATRGATQAVIATSIGFALAHSATGLSPDQSVGTTIETIVFAFLFGVIAALLVRTTGCIWPAIGLHATFDLAGFVLTPRSSALTDAVSIAVAALVVIALLVLGRRVQS